MAHIVVYCTSPEEAAAIREQLDPILEEWEEQPLYHEFVGDRPGFLRYVKGNPYLMILVAQSGPEGKATVRMVKEANPKAWLLWFAAENYALDAFSIHITHFAQLPVNRKKLDLALESCWPPPNDPYSSTMTL